MTAIVLLWFCVAIILCFLWFDSRSRWYWKLPLFPLLIFSTLLVGNGYKDFLGWPLPKDEIVQKEFEFHWAIIREQEKEILLWITYDHNNGWLDFYKVNKDEPRVIKLPYTKQLHKKAQEGIEIKKVGGRVGAKKKGKKGEGKEGSPTNSDLRYEEEEYIFYILPSIQPIQKDN